MNASHAVDVRQFYGLPATMNMKPESTAAPVVTTAKNTSKVVNVLVETDALTIGLVVVTTGVGGDVVKGG